MNIIRNALWLIIFGTMISACGGENTISAENCDYLQSTSVAQRLENELATVGIGNFTASNYKPGVVRHIVLFRYKDTVTAEQRRDISRRFLELQKSRRNGTTYIVSIEEGTQSSGEMADQRLQQGFIVTFNSEGDRNFYVGRPIISDPNYYDANHQAFKNFIGPLLAPRGALVFDYTINQTSSGAE
ncbi:Dabb family protein [Burkholderia vietnamiensis]|uniref:Dabb family protein n=1 Tax=Burkholderia vietnamiensis TaxID=60552 RepID=UPI0018C75BD2|nr:Dabb family protein [Burkholderia vietnamiensis]